MWRGFILMTVLLALPACDRSKINESEYKEAGGSAILPFKKSLKGALVSGLESGPVAAISVCRMDAPELAAAASKGGVRVGRTSSKLRNPANAAKPWMVPLLQRYEADRDAREPAVVVIDKQTVGYVEPIFMQPLCVTCHGETLAPELEAKLDELYPDDQARGYAAGDFRGVFWAELPRD